MIGNNYSKSELFTKNNNKERLTNKEYFKKSYIVSMITVTYNDKEALGKTILSVIAQEYKNIELIVIDGASTDGTLDIINKYNKKITHWISEKDNGIYDAMNKGINLANGDFVIFMNSGDIFYDKNTIEKFINQVNNIDKVYFGRAKIQNSTTSWVYPNEKYNKNNINVWLRSNLPNHQAMFFPKKFYKNYLYNLDYKIGSDSDYKFQSQSEFGFVFIDDIICKFEFGGVSSEFSSFKNTKQILKDSWLISMKHKGMSYAIMRQIKIVSKYLLISFFGINKFKNILKKIRS